MSEQALWIDADETGHEIEIQVELLHHDDGDTDLEITLPFGQLGGVLVVHLGRGIAPEQTRFMHNREERAA